MEKKKTCGWKENLLKYFKLTTTKVEARKRKEKKKKEKHPHTERMNNMN